VLSVGSLSSDAACALTASYTYGGVTKTASKSVTLKDLVTSRPNLVVSDVWIVPSTPSPGGSTTISLQVANLGGATTGSSFVLELYIDSVYQGRVTITALAAGGVYTAEWRAMTWPSDFYPHEITGVVDTEGRITETDETDNTRWEWFAAQQTDTTAPTVVSTNPVNNEYYAATTDTVTATFSEDVTLGPTPIILIDRVGNPVPVRQVLVSGRTLTILLVAPLAYSMGYGVGLNADVVRDSAGNPNQEYSWVFITRAAPLQVTAVSPARPTAQPTRQWLSVLGTGFVSGSQATLRIGGSTYAIPADRTQFVSGTEMRLYVGLTDAGTWSVQIANPDGTASNTYSFQVTS
jgi:hypothetical protein